MPSLRARGALVASAAGLTGLNATNAISLAFWMRLHGAATSSDIFRQRATANARRDGYRMGFSAGEMQLGILGSAGLTNSSFNARLSRHRHGRWAHYVVTFDDATNFVRFYVDGKMIAAASNTRDMTANAACTTEVAYVGVNSALNGNLFDLQVLPEVVISPHDAPRFMRPDYRHGGVRGRWFGLGFTDPGPSGTIVDESGNGNNLTASANAADCLQGDEPPFRPTYT